ncbi:hypothetical protein QAD02_019410 [Eretmocerus hayati]|uniref:Uncharacterized protein n=1 Tax=Eretmocerus hayati TaxID=131215 RepID=A0ACC2PJI3_9HYME|nr:hypothetical protein QAD02_019410 [Eretmocerus hayati]
MLGKLIDMLSDGYPELCIDVLVQAVINIPVYARLTRLDGEELSRIGRPSHIDAFLLEFEESISESPASPSPSNRGPTPPPRQQPTPEFIDLTSPRSLTPGSMPRSPESPELTDLTYPRSSTPESTPRSPESSQAHVSCTPQSNSGEFTL